MGIRRLLLGLVGVGLLTSCTEATNPVSPDATEFEISADHTNGLFKVKGGGKYFIPFGDGALESRFRMNIRQISADGSARGRFRHRVDFNGELIDFTGVTTCMIVEEETGRAWVGGVVHKNRSVAEPWASGDIYKPGKDIWFRVLDAGKNKNREDRTTFTGFEGSGDIITSQEYCDAQIWPDDNARTQQIVNGGVRLVQR